MNKIRIGTRGSKLALKQAALVQEALRQAEGGIETEIVVLHTQGDKILDKPLAEIGDKGIFVSEFEQALLEERIDIAVHSAKDLPVKPAQGLDIVAVLPRGDVRDVLVIPKGGRHPELVEEYPVQSSFDLHDTVAEKQRGDGRTFVIGTGSRRRQKQAEQLWENVTCENIRGNVDTRLRKLRDGSGGTTYDAIILAKAGLDRLEIMSQYGDQFEFYPLPPEQFLPAACQGIIAVEAVQDSPAAEVCRKITDAMTELCFQVEREVLEQLAADCSEAAAAWCRQERGSLILDVMYAGDKAKQSSAETGTEKWDKQLRAGLEMARKAAELVKEKG
ncbi:MAG: hydroxymethylbilane synthase [Lachnospiraceae bacterium]|nr:hydroxymethylbilane synthase [Lachnospiraceae bacterium]